MVAAVRPAVKLRGLPALLLTVGVGVGLGGAVPGLAAAQETEPEPATPAATSSVGASVEERAGKEVEELHTFFEAWFNGTVENTDEVYARLTDVLAEGFVRLGPTGNLTERGTVVDGLRESYAPQGTEPIRIWIEGFHLRHRVGEVVVVTYEEWQQRGSQKRGRLSTAVLREDVEAPNGLVWLHVHETWLPR